jgi:hypothetical protein
MNKYLSSDDKENLADYIEKRIIKKYRKLPRFRGTPKGFTVDVIINETQLHLRYDVEYNKFKVVYEKDIIGFDEYDVYQDVHYFDTLLEVYEYTDYVIDMIKPPQMF